MAVPFSARCLLFFAAAIQDTRHSVISLVTGVLENPALALPPGNCGRPGFRPGCWIVECDFVIDRVGIETREALDHMQAAGGTSEVRLVGEIRRIDDQCVAVPRPRESPRYWRMRWSRCGLPSNGTTRAS